MRDRDDFGLPEQRASTGLPLSIYAFISVDDCSLSDDRRRPLEPGKQGCRGLHLGTLNLIKATQATPPSSSEKRRR